MPNPQRGDLASFELTFPQVRLSGQLIPAAARLLQPPT